MHINLCNFHSGPRKYILLLSSYTGEETEAPEECSVAGRRHVASGALDSFLQHCTVLSQNRQVPRAEEDGAQQLSWRPRDSGIPHDSLGGSRKGASPRCALVTSPEKWVSNGLDEAHRILAYSRHQV